MRSVSRTFTYGVRRGLRYCSAMYDAREETDMPLGSYNSVLYGSSQFELYASLARERWRANIGERWRTGQRVPD